MTIHFDPSEPDGKNDSLVSQISSDGTPNLGERYVVPARCGVAVRLSPGQTLVIENTFGTQVCDFWAFHAEDMNEHLSMAHVHTELNSVNANQGDRLITNRRRAILTFEMDTSPGVHDTVIASCDHHRYQQLGCDVYHDNCTDNLRMALIAIGERAPVNPAPFNIWMNIPIDQNGEIQWLPPVSAAGDTVAFRAELPCVAVMSACPQDLVPINGAESVPQAVHFHVEA